MATHRVLIVDDERNIRLTLKGALEAIGLEVEAVFQGEEALQKLAENSYDAMILDLRLPGMDGLEAIRRIRAHEDKRISEIPIIAVTALAMIGDHEICLAAGANDYMSKPVQLNNLVNRIKKNLSQNGGSK